MYITNTPIIIFLILSLISLFFIFIYFLYYKYRIIISIIRFFIFHSHKKKKIEKRTVATKYTVSKIIYSKNKFPYIYQQIYECQIPSLKHNTKLPHYPFPTLLPIIPHIVFNIRKFSNFFKIFDLSANTTN